MDTEIRVSTESWPWRRKFPHHSCQESNLWPFDHIPVLHHWALSYTHFNITLLRQMQRGSLKFALLFCFSFTTQIRRGSNLQRCTWQEVSQGGGGEGNQEVFILLLFPVLQKHRCEWRRWNRIYWKKLTQEAAKRQPVWRKHGQFFGGAADQSLQSHQRGSACEWSFAFAFHRVRVIVIVDKSGQQQTAE